MNSKKSNHSEGMTRETSLQDTFERIAKQLEEAKLKAEARSAGAAASDILDDDSAIIESVGERTEKAAGIAVKLFDLIGKVGRGMKSLDAGEKLATASSVLGSAPMIGVAFEALLPIVEAFNESVKIDPKMKRLLERVGDLLGYVERYVDKESSAVAEKSLEPSSVKDEIDFFCNIVKEMVRIEKRRTGVCKGVKELWFASSNSEKLDRLQTDIDRHLHDLKYKATLYQCRGKQSEREWARLRSNRPKEKEQTTKGTAFASARRKLDSVGRNTTSKTSDSLSPRTSELCSARAPLHDDLCGWQRSDYRLYTNHGLAGLVLGLCLIDGL